jgi:hypothetical protein
MSPELIFIFGKRKGGNFSTILEGLDQNLRKQKNSSIRILLLKFTIPICMQAAIVWLDVAVFLGESK